jgi:uncharacterized repeat protein (TIGR03803 family)
MFTVLLSHRRDGSSLKKHSLPATMCIVFCLAAAMAVSAQSVYFTTLASFDGTNGYYPYGGLVQATDGNFYGTTFIGGGYGNVFKITPAGTLTSLHTFDDTDGELPWAGLVQASDGNLYGTTEAGGEYFWGTVFKITTSGSLTSLHSFNGLDGVFPYAGLVQASDGNLYGTTLTRGSYGDGTVFRITPSGVLTVLYNFAGPDGANPIGTLVQGSDGSLYGTTQFGGTNTGSDCSFAYEPPGCGTTFKITLDGTLTTLHSFNYTDGAQPLAGLMQAADGNFYGTTYNGANGGSVYCNYGCGTLFKMTSSGTLTTLYKFSFRDGANPLAVLVQAADGNFYGTTQSGGGYSLGTVFEITPAGILTTLHNFDGDDGQTPWAGLVEANDGNLYGTTEGGGIHGAGTVFRLGVVRHCTTCRP